MHSRWLFLGIQWPSVGRAGPRSWRAGRALLLSMCLATLPACTKRYEVADVSGINGALDYLPWGPCQEVKDGRPRPDDATLRIVPGMRLTFRFVPLHPPVAHSQVPGLQSFEWIVPRSDFTSQDYFLFSYLVSTAQVNGVNPIALLDEYSRFEASASASAQGNTGTINDALAQRLLCPAFASLRLSHRREGAPSETPCTAAAAREWLESPTWDEFKHPRPRQGLLLNVPGSERCTLIETFHWSGSHFQNVIQKAQKNPTNPMYTANAEGAQGHVSVEVPVRFEMEFESRYVPVYWSFADLERRYGVRIRGFRRHPSFLSNLRLSEVGAQEDPYLRCADLVREHNLLPAARCGQSACVEKPAPTPSGGGRESALAIADEGTSLAGMHEDGACERLLTPGSGYFTAWFEDKKEAYGASAVLHLPAKLRTELLVAPGDVIIVDEHRSAPTDAPEVR